ncbi:MAG: hypothetical protein EOP53_18575 [Sphingobacteriales bacterium]|nr:MAG: hypothetical protein EOP53_18575 [Sphingobacteriales bacterium]
MKKIFSLTLSIIFFCIATNAQEVIISGEALYNTNFSIINSAITGNSKTKKKPTTAIKKLSPANLRFNRSEAVSKKVQEDFIIQLSKTQPQQKAQIQQLFAQNKMRKQFDDLLKTYNYSSLNLADAMTAYLVISWQVVHSTEFNDKKGFDAVRKMITDILVKSESLATASDIEKQTVAETFGYQAIIAMQSYKTIKATNTNGLPALQDAIYQNSKAAGIDLKKYKLSSAGFVKL